MRFSVLSHNTRTVYGEYHFYIVYGNVMNDLVISCLLYTSVLKLQKNIAMTAAIMLQALILQAS